MQHLNYGVLKPTEYGRLPAEFNAPFERFTPGPNRIVLIAEDENRRIVGAVAITQEIHVEPLWVREDARGFRGSVVAYRLMKLAEDLIPAGIPIFVATVQDKMKKYLTRRGWKTLGQSFVKERQ